MIIAGIDFITWCISFEYNLEDKFKFESSVLWMNSMGDRKKSPRIIEYSLFCKFFNLKNLKFQVPRR